MNVEGSVAVVTGGGGGIGRALTLALARAGAQVVAVDRDDATLAGTLAAVEAERPGAAVVVTADVASEEALRGVLATAESAFGPVDLFCANAGVPGATDLFSTEAEWDLAIDVNLMAHVRAARLLVPGWVERGSGYFLATASAAGLLTQIGSAPYSVTKHAAVGFAEWLSITYGDQGVGVSCLCPMGVDTAMLNAGLDSDDENMRHGARVVAEAGEVLSPEEVADEVLRAIDAERFLVLPHPEVAEFFRRKALDYDRWLGGMRRMQARVAG